MTSNHRLSTTTLDHIRLRCYFKCCIYLFQVNTIKWHSHNWPDTTNAWYTLRTHNKRFVQVTNVWYTRRTIGTRDERLAHRTNDWYTWRTIGTHDERAVYITSYWYTWRTIGTIDERLVQTTCHWYIWWAIGTQDVRLLHMTNDWYIWRTTNHTRRRNGYTSRLTSHSGTKSLLTPNNEDLLHMLFFISSNTIYACPTLSLFSICLFFPPLAMKSTNI